MTKAKEIEILQSLVGDTYFNDYFSTEDIKTMCCNIKNDLPLGLNCAFAKKAEVAEKKLIEERKAADEEILDIAEQMITEEAAGGVAINIIERKIGMDNTIRIKHKNNIPFTKEELDYLVKKLD